MYKKIRPSNGVTFVEMLLAVAILAVAVLMAKFVIDLMTTSFRQKAMMETQRDVQLELYNVSRDIRNAINIIHLSSDTLVLETLDVSKGFDTTTNPGLFLPTNISTITYRFITGPNESYLQRRQIRDGNIINHSLLKNTLIKPDVTNYLFGDPYRPAGSPPPYDSVEIVFRIKPVFNRDKSPLFRTEAMKRSPNL